MYEKVLFYVLGLFLRKELPFFWLYHDFWHTLYMYIYIYSIMKRNHRAISLI